MSRTFPVTQIETSVIREVLLALELVDPVSFQPVSEGLTVTAEGLDRAAIVNGSGRFVWLKEDARAPTRIVVQANGEPYRDLEIAGPFVGPLVSRMLEPTPAYLFPDELAVLRGVLVERIGGTLTPLAAAEISVEVLSAPHPLAPASLWSPGTITVRSDAAGTFAAPVLLPPGVEPDRPSAAPSGRADLAGLNVSQLLAVRLAIRKAGGPERRTPATMIADGRAASLADPRIIWNDIA